MNQVRYLAKTVQNKLSQMVAKWTVAKTKYINLFHLSIEFLLIFGYRWSYSSPGCVINMNTTRWDCNQHYCYFFRHCWQYHYVTHLLPVVKPETGLQLTRICLLQIYTRVRISWNFQKLKKSIWNVNFSDIEKHVLGI